MTSTSQSSSPGSPPPQAPVVSLAVARPEAPAVARTKADLVFVLLLVQAGTILLAALGELLFMGGLPFYLVVPAIRIILLLTFGALVLRASRTGLVGLIVLQAFSVGGFFFSAVAGLLPQVDFTPTLTGLFSSLVLPLVTGFYAIQLFVRRPS